MRMPEWLDHCQLSWNMGVDFVNYLSCTRVKEGYGWHILTSGSLCLNLFDNDLQSRGWKREQSQKSPPHAISSSNHGKISNPLARFELDILKVNFFFKLF